MSHSNDTTTKKTDYVSKSQRWNHTFEARWEVVSYAWNKQQSNTGATINVVSDRPQIAARLGLSRSQIYAMVAERSIPHYKIGGAIRFHPEEIDEWLVQSRIPVAQ